MGGALVVASGGEDRQGSGEVTTAHGACLRLALPCPGALRVMTILGLDAVLPIYPSLEEAVAGRGEGDAESFPPHEPGT